MIWESLCCRITLQVPGLCIFTQASRNILIKHPKHVSNHFLRAALFGAASSVSSSFPLLALRFLPAGWLSCSSFSSLTSFFSYRFTFLQSYKFVSLCIYRPYELVAVVWIEADAGSSSRVRRLCQPWENCGAFYITFRYSHCRAVGSQELKYRALTR